MDPDRSDAVLEEALAYLSNEPVKRGVRGNMPLIHGLESLERYATEWGLDPPTLSTVFNLAIGHKLPISVRRRIVRVLLPRTTVSMAIVTRALSYMCVNADNFSFMALLLRWLVLVLPYIEDRDQLCRLYDVIFHFLQSDVICPHACELLYHVTRKQDVRMHRVQELMRLQQKKGAEPYLMGLLTVYKLYCPHLVSVAVPSGRKNFFRGTDRAWADRMRAVQQKRGSERDENDISSNRPPAAKRARRKLPEIVPSVLAEGNENRRQQGTPGNQRESRVPFAHIRSFSQLLSNFDRLELPGQLAAALTDRNLQHVLACYPDPAMALRITYWLDHRLYREFFVAGGSDRAYCVELLESLVRLTEFLQEGVPVCHNFLTVYLQSWSGTAYRKPLLQLITHCPLHSYTELCDILDPLRKLFFSSPVSYKCEIVETLTSLLRNLLHVELPRHQQTIERASADDRAGVFSEGERESVKATETIQELIRFTDTLCCIGLQLERDHAALSYCALDFFSLVASMYSECGLPVVEVCSKPLLYRHLYSLNPVSLACLFALIVSYRKSFVALQSVVGTEFVDVSTQQARSTSLEQVPALNEYIVNVCDALVRRKAFVSKEPRAVMSVAPGELSGVSVRRLAKAYALYRHPALMCYVHSFLRETQEAGSYVHPGQIRPHRATFLRYLSQRHLNPLATFIDTFIRPATPAADASAATTFSTNNPPKHSVSDSPSLPTPDGNAANASSHSDPPKQPAFESPSNPAPHGNAATILSPSDPRRHHSSESLTPPAPDDNSATTVSPSKSPYPNSTDSPSPPTQDVIKTSILSLSSPPRHPSSHSPAPPAPDDNTLTTTTSPQ